MKMFLKKNYSIIFVGLIAILILIKNALLVGFMHHHDHFGYHLFYGQGFIGLKIILEILFISFIFSISLFFKKKGRYIYIFLIYIVIMILNVVDMFYCRCFQGAPGVYWLFMPSEGPAEGSSYFMDSTLYVSWLDILFFIDLPFVIFMLIFGFKKDLFTYPRLNTPLFMCVSLLTLISVTMISPKTIITSNNTENQVAAYTSLGYHLIDIKESITIREKVKINEENLNDLKNYQTLLKNDEASATDSLNANGVLKNTNLIFIQLEAFESFCLNNSIKGVEITPNLNKMLNNSYHFDLVEQVRAGNSCDCDIMMMTGMLPTAKGVAMVHYNKTEYHSLAEELELDGYKTLYINSSTHSPWGYKKVETTTLGFQNDFYDITGEKKTAGYVADEYILETAFNKIKEFGSEKYYTHVVLTSQHFPYVRQKEFFDIDLDEMGRVGNYINWSHYVDKCIGDFVAKLESENMLDNTTIVITGDHGGIHKYATNLSNKEAKKYPFIGTTKDYTVPYIVYNKNLSKQYIDVIGGQVDALPTLAYMYDLKFNYKDGRIFMGRNLLKTNLSYAYMPNGILKGSLTKEEKKILSKGFYLSDRLIRGYYFNDEEA